MISIQSFFTTPPKIMISFHSTPQIINLKTQTQSFINQLTFQYQSHTQKNNQNSYFHQLENKLQRLKLFIHFIGPKINDPIPSHKIIQLQRHPNQLVGVDSDFVIKQTEKKIQKMKKMKKVKKNWSSVDIKILVWIICICTQQQNLSALDIEADFQFWKYISQIIPGSTPQSCLFKWLGQRKYKITSYSWKFQEERLLIQLQKKYTDTKNKWKFISQELYLNNPNKQKLFRQAKQCRQHYTSFLDPNVIKGPWSKQEDLILLNHLILNKGQKKWCKLVKKLQGRTQNAIKNRYQLIISKLMKKKQNKNKNQYSIIEEYLRINDKEFENKLNNKIIQREGNVNIQKGLSQYNRDQIICYKQEIEQNKIKWIQLKQVRQIKQKGYSVGIVKQQYDSDLQEYNYLPRQNSTVDSLQMMNKRVQLSNNIELEQKQNKQTNKSELIRNRQQGDTNKQQININNLSYINEINKINILNKKSDQGQNNMAVKIQQKY